MYVVSDCRYSKEDSADYLAQKILMTEVFHMSQKLCPLTLEELGQNNATECGSAQMMHSMVDKHKDLLPRVEEVVDKEDEHIPGNLAQDIRKSVSTPMEARSQEACQVSSMPHGNGFSHP